MGNILKKFKYLIPKERSANNHQQTNEGGRDWENMYRDRWSFDKCVRSTHGVNCTGSCSWNIYVKNGLVAWENQVHDYPETSPEMPDFEPRGCPRGAVFRGICTVRTELNIRICAGSWLNFGEMREKIIQMRWKLGRVSVMIPLK